MFKILLLKFLLLKGCECRSISESGFKSFEFYNILFSVNVSKLVLRVLGPSLKRSSILILSRNFKSKIKSLKCAKGDHRQSFHSGKCPLKIPASSHFSINMQFFVVFLWRPTQTKNSKENIFGTRPILPPIFIFFLIFLRKKYKKEKNTQNITRKDEQKFIFNMILLNYIDIFYLCNRSQIHIYKPIVQLTVSRKFWMISTVINCLWVMYGRVGI